jgi:hypothetical protein
MNIAIISQLLLQFVSTSISIMELIREVLQLIANRLPA